MSYYGLSLPKRQLKPRKYGISVLIDNGIPLDFFKDTISSAGEFIDFVKFGWGTSIITNTLDEKIAFLHENGVEFFFGGTLFEKFLSQGKVDEFHRYNRNYGANYIEISNGTFEISNKEKAGFIADFSKEFRVFSEVGQKDSSIANTQGADEWVEYIQEDLEAGAAKVITEARESGTSGMCKDNGEMRFDIIDQILLSGINLDKIIFEAPTKAMQTAFIKMAGANVNLANIPFSDPIALETLRLGLRSDTFFQIEKEEKQ